jgi:hypothetical protein
MKKLILFFLLLLTGCSTYNASVLYHYGELRITTDYDEEWKNNYLDIVEKEITNYPNAETVFVFFLENNQPKQTIKATPIIIKELLKTNDWEHFLTKAEFTNHNI